MSKTARYMVPFVGAGALLASAFTGAVASRPAPLHDLARAKVKSFTVNGRLTVTNVLRVNSNVSSYGRLYAHGGEQIWQGLLVRSGGVKADSMEVTGPITAQNATITGNLAAGILQAQTINGTGTLTVTGAAHIGGTLASDGKVTANGIDAQSGGVTTTGNISAAGITGASLAVGSLTDSGNLQAATGTFNNLNVAGNVNFSNATVTGLNLSNLTGSNLTSLSVGSTSGTIAPLNLTSNGRTATVNVNSDGSLAVGAITASNGGTFGGTLAAGNGSYSGALTVNSQLNVPAIAGLIPTGQTTNGPLSLTGSTITLSGNTLANGDLTVGQAHDLILASGGGANTASHINAGANPDVAGLVTLTVPGGTVAGVPESASQAFTRAYAGRPAVVLTPAGDPAPGTSTMPKYWVSLDSTGGLTTGFTVHFLVPASTSLGYAVPFSYHVIAGTSS